MYRREVVSDGREESELLFWERGREEPELQRSRVVSDERVSRLFLLGRGRERNLRRSTVDSTGRELESLPSDSALDELALDLLEPSCDVHNSLRLRFDFGALGLGASDSGALGSGALGSGALDFGLVALAALSDAVALSVFGIDALDFNALELDTLDFNALDFDSHAFALAVTDVLLIAFGLGSCGLGGLLDFFARNAVFASLFDFGALEIAPLDGFFFSCPYSTHKEKCMNICDGRVGKTLRLAHEI